MELEDAFSVVGGLLELDVSDRELAVQRLEGLDAGRIHAFQLFMQWRKVRKICDQTFTAIHSPDCTKRRTDSRNR